MDFDIFKDKVLAFGNEAKSRIDKVDNKGKADQLKSLIVLLDKLVDFLNDELSISVLKNYLRKKDYESELYPLDGISKDVCERFESIEELLRASILNYFVVDNTSSELLVQSDLNGQNYGILYGQLIDGDFSNSIAAFNVLKHLDGHNKTLIVLGPNGSGKTSLANYLKNLNTHIKIIPASKPINTTGHIPSIYNSSITNYNEELYRGGVLNQDLLQKLIIGMCTEHDNIARKYMDTGKRDGKSIYEKVKDIFDQFFEVKLDNTSFSAKKMKAIKGDSSPFDFNNMSDGERVAFFYIATVIAAPPKSFIIVDEPENHLNPAVYNKIWEKLLETRRDCQFIFISHTIDFVGARSNYELVKIKNFVYPGTFEFEFLGNTLDNIQPELIVEIIGSRKPILFCEGSKSDFDYKIYEILFGDMYTVVPTGNCTAVEKSVEACNLHAATYSIQSAIGIIDSDLKSEKEIEQLKKKNVYSLKCNEIEMLLLDELIFTKALKRVFKSVELFDEFKRDFFAKLKERKDIIIKRLVKTQIDERLKNTFIDDRANKTKEDIKTNLSDIMKRIDVDKLWEECEAYISCIIDEKKYEEALRYCCLEHGEILFGLGNKIIPDYSAIALGVLRENVQLANEIRQKYFGDIDLKDSDSEVY